MAVITQVDDSTWINEFGGLVSEAGHASAIK